MADTQKIVDNIASTVEDLSQEAKFLFYYYSNDCFRGGVNQLYQEYLDGAGHADLAFDFDVTGVHGFNVPIKVYNTRLSAAQAKMQSCLGKSAAKNKNNNVNVKPSNVDVPSTQPSPGYIGPFDKRLKRAYINESGNSFDISPLDARYATTSVNGYVTNQEFIKNANVSDDQRKNLEKKLKDDIQRMQNDIFHFGVPSLMNNYSITRLYGSNGGQYLINQKGQRKWYEVDSLTNSSQIDFANNPTTSSLISWGNGDPYGRTPYNFSDFAFCKNWRIIPNNRMITLRRFAAPILDNMKFPGMDGATQVGTSGQSDVSTGANNNSNDKGSGQKVNFPPVATAVTYFGENTGNSLSGILKFSTGMNWGEVQAKMFEVTTATADNEAGPGKMFGGLASLAKMLNIVNGDYDSKALMNQGALPPDPYSNGPYENRIMGPVNRIDAVKKREAGLKYENKIDLVFEYVGRPIGGINPKAALLDILTNFLIMGSASAMFWGGQHRFVSNPPVYPFIGGMKEWYSGDPKGYAQTTMQSFGDNISKAGGGIADFAKQFFNTILSGKGTGNIMGELTTLFTGKNAGGNIIRQQMAKRSNGQVPYLTGLKALLIGEPVGEWHVTIGNPLNPIAMIGNLICQNIEVEFGEELGPDDFPTTMKITVHLEHGMARDRDAIQSIFNRGMGRIYDLPDALSTSADYQTKVDQYTGNGKSNATGTPVGGRNGFLANTGSYGRSTGKPAIKSLTNTGETTVWNRSSFSIISPDAPLQTDFRSTYKSLTWVAQKSLQT